MYAAMMSANNLGAGVSTLAGGVITSLLGITETRFTNLWILLVICSSAALLPLLLVDVLLPEHDLQTSQGAALATEVFGEQPGDGPGAGDGSSSARQKRQDGGGAGSAAGSRQSEARPLLAGDAIDDDNDDEEEGRTKITSGRS